MTERDIVERLRAHAGGDDGVTPFNPDGNLVNEAADTIATLTRERDEARERLAMAEETLNDAHFLLCFNHQDCVEADPPKDPSGCCYWRVWHLHPRVYDRMTLAEQSLYTMLMRYEHAEQERARRALAEIDGEGE